MNLLESGLRWSEMEGIGAAADAYEHGAYPIDCFEEWEAEIWNKRHINIYYEGLDHEC